MKICSVCNKEKELSEFHVAKRNKFGVKPFCKECAVEKRRLQYEKEKQDPILVDINRIKSRERARKYSKVPGYNKRDRGEAHKSRVFQSRYPEIYNAQRAAKAVYCPEHHERHHWSYNEEHMLDVIILEKTFHTLLHMYMFYDPKSHTFITLAGTRLNSKEVHIKFIEAVKNMF